MASTIQWTEAAICAAILERAVDGVCSGSGDQTLPTVARRMFGSWAAACRRVGVRAATDYSGISRVCEVSGCTNEKRSNGARWCEMHYGRNRRNGDPHKTLLLQYSVNHEAFDELSPSSAWAIGMLWSDGYMRNNQIGIKSKDIEIVEQMRSILGTTVPVRESTANGRKYFRIEPCSPRITERLRQMGMSEAKSLVIGYPRLLPEPLFWDFLRGVIDGDGCVHTHQNRPGQRAMDCIVDVVSGSRSFAEELSKRIASNGVECSLGKSVRGRANPLWKILIRKQSSLRLLYERLYAVEGAPRLTRKWLKFKQWYETPRARAGRAKGDTRLKRTGGGRNL